MASNELLVKNWKKHLFEKIDPESISLSTFEVKDSLNLDVWEDEDFIKADIKQNIERIARDFIESLGIEVNIDDITITGSVANYNWSRFSDIDVHILVDFDEIDENHDLVREMFQKAHAQWNRTHDIRVNDHEIEIYVQDIDEPHHSTGIYSLLGDKWVEKPEKTTFSLNKDEIQAKAAHLMDDIDEIERLMDTNDPEQAFDDASRLKEKIRNFRRGGLEKGGEYSSENLAFKVLRRNGYLERLSDMKNEAYDKMLSLEEETLHTLQEELLQEVTFEDAQKTLRNRVVKLVKSYNYEQGLDPEKNLGSLSTGLENRILSLIPSDIEDNQQGTSLLWVLRLLKDPKLKEIIFKTVVSPGPPGPVPGVQMARADYNVEFGNIRNNLETFFQFQRFMDPTDINKLKDADSLTNVVAGARAAIEADKDKKLGADASKGAEFFQGNFKFDENGNVARDEEGLPQFETKDGWVIAAAHNKGAACLLGKKTNWCTAAPGLNYFDQYYNGEDDPLFFLMDPDGNRYQFAYGAKEFMDADDERVRGDRFEDLNNKLKEALEAKFFEDRFSVVFEYEEVDYEARVSEILEENRHRIDDNRINIDASVDDYYEEEVRIEGGFDATYLFSLPPDYDGVQDLQEDSYDMISAAFDKIMSTISLGHQEDAYGESHEYIYLEFGGGVLKVTMSGNWSGYGENGLDELNTFLYDAVNDLEGNYDKIRNMLREVLIVEMVLPKTKYDKMFFDIYEVDEEGEELETDREGAKEQFELSLDNITIDIDEGEGTIEFSFRFPTPKALRSGSNIGKRPKNKELIMHAANKRTSDFLARQPELPGVDGGGGEQEALDMLTHTIKMNPQIQINMMVGHESTIVDFVVNINDLDESEIDQIAKSFGVIDKNIEAYRKAMHNSFVKYIEKFPAEFPTPASGEEGTLTETADVSNEPYQRKARKWFGKAMRLTVKGGNKYKVKGMKNIDPKVGKSPPPGME